MCVDNDSSSIRSCFDKSPKCTVVYSAERFGTRQSGKSLVNGLYQGADKSLARPGTKQARKHVRDARDFNNIETRAVKFFFFPSARQDAEGNSRHSDRNISLFPSWSGQGLISIPVQHCHLVSLIHILLNCLRPNG